MSALATWQESAQRVLDLTQGLTEEQWQLPTPCPGWSVGDIVAHLLDIESMLAGDERAVVEVDWASTPHVRNDLGRVTEMGVQAHRGKSREQVLTQYRDVIQRRSAQLDGVTGQVPGIHGKPVPVEVVLGMRTFDTWVHEQDIRSAVGESGGMTTTPAHTSAAMMIAGLPKAWAKGVGAPAGSTLRITVTGPEIEHDVTVAVDAEGKGRVTEHGESNVHLTMTWPDYFLLATGRADLHDAAFRDRIQAAGDPELVERVLPALNVSP
jgi:uncharacterized protein (TIGR03083 family)